MPQFDPSVFSPQLVWLVITFVALYLLMSRVALPRISDVLEEREHKINDNLRKAERLREDAEAAVAAYEIKMADARAKAQEALRQAREQMAEEAAERHERLSERLSEKVNAGEARIAEARNAAMAGVRDMAIEIAASATQRLIGGRLDKKSVTGAVDAILEKTP